MVVGCGSLGNELLKDLVLLGVEHLVLVDFDRVEMDNLSRTVLFTPDDVGRYKVDAARDRLRQMNARLEVETICADIIHDVGLGLIAEMDLVVACVDSRWTRFMINRHCMRTGRVWVDGGITQAEGSVRVFGAQVANCYACNLGGKKLTELQRRLSCSQTIRRMEEMGHVPTGLIPAAVVGAVMARQVMDLLNGSPSLQGHMYSFDADTLLGHKVLFQAFDDDCVEHDVWTPIRHCTLTSESTISEAIEQCNTLWLRDDCFVDYLIDRKDDTRHQMMCAGRMVVERMDMMPALRGRLTSDFYQHEYHVVDADFPYPMLTLQQLGIPSGDILQTAQGFYQLRNED